MNYILYCYFVAASLRLRSVLYNSVHQKSHLTWIHLSWWPSPIIQEIKTLWKMIYANSTIVYSLAIYVSSSQLFCYWLVAFHADLWVTNLPFIQLLLLFFFFVCASAMAFIKCCWRFIPISVFLNFWVFALNFGHKSNEIKQESFGYAFFDIFRKTKMLS